VKPLANEKPPPGGKGPGSPMTKPSPFQKAINLCKWLKLFLWGDSGVGKTWLALHFPKVAVIDLEGGTDLYGQKFDFEVFRVSEAYEVMAAVDWLLTNRHDFQTLVIDPISVYWDALQKKWSEVFLQRNKGSKGFRHEYYDFQPKDWLTIKSELKELIRKLTILNMHVVVTAREKPLYADSGFMRAIGTTFDGEKSLPYLFDTIVRLYRDDKNRFMGRCLKDRSGRLPGDDFEVSFAVFERLLGTDGPAAGPSSK
jgi:hypothetical protein